ncbi:Ff.00g038530.m01.CDS01 [Fusarium sp. VM40]|nr:Ff.00g038530.m01.CDS01 [Fusarium sp. VM40]
MDTSTRLEPPRSLTSEETLLQSPVMNNNEFEGFNNDGSTTAVAPNDEICAESADTALDPLQFLTDIDKLASLDEVEHGKKIRNLARVSQYESLGKDVLTREREAGNLTMRARQSILHHTFTTLRIDDLEKEMRDLRNIIQNKDGETESPVSKEDKFPIHKHELRASTIDEFRLNRDRVMLPPEEQPALEMQLNPAAISAPLSKEVGREEHEAPPRLTRAPTMDSKGTYYMPIEKLRIRSRPLMTHLEALTGRSMISVADSDTLLYEDVFSAIVILRPFKLFVRYETAIRESVEDVESLIEADAARKEKKGVEDRKSNNSSEEKYENTDLLEDLDLLVRFLDNDLRPMFDFRQQIKDGTASRIEYSDLWHLFERGDIVIARAHQDHAYLVVNFSGGRDVLAKESTKEETPITVGGFVVDCVSLGSNGSTYVPKLEKISIKKFHGSQAIYNLAVYPLRFDPNAAEIRARFLSEGRKFVRLTQSPFCHKRVCGRTLDEPSHDLDAQVIVDMSLAMNAKSEWRLKQTLSTDELTPRDKRETEERSWCKHTYRESCCGGDVILKDLEIDDLEAEEFAGRMGRILGPLKSEDLTEDDLMLMRPNLHAFVLRSRQWVTVRTADIHDVVFENSFNDLILPPEHKRTVQALVKTHENGRNSQDSTKGGSSIGVALDLVKGKGSGLIILLHGPPGVGKTSTAECVADDTRRPLYPITCGDIGETAAEVEANLQYNFQLAHKWGCVLLLDEADIFLARRTRTDLRHNAVTSVFLRSLEYYEGILFLTTNRVGVIDPAFKSRVQMFLFYPKLSLDVTYKLYEKFIQRAEDEQNRTGSYFFKIKKKEILKFAKSHFRRLEKRGWETWNGRQIRNAFQTAIALAEHESMTMDVHGTKPSLGKEQFERVAEGFREFDEYLITATGSTEADIAKREGIRNDAFMTTPVVPMAAISTPAYGTQHKQRVRPSAYDSSSDDDSESESDTDNDDGSSRQRVDGRKVTVTLTNKQSDVPSAGLSQQEQYQQFLDWQKMQAQ